MVFLSGATAVVALLLGSIISTWLLIKESEALQSAVVARGDAENARAKEAQLRHAAESRETVKEIGLRMALNQYAQADELLDRLSLQKPSPRNRSPVADTG